MESEETILHDLCLSIAILQANPFAGRTYLHDLFRYLPSRPDGVAFYRQAGPAVFLLLQAHG
jgi:hypothetical protein